MGIGVVILCLYPGMRSPFAKIQGSDKLIHMMVFCGLSLLVYSEYLYKHRHQWRGERIWKPFTMLLLVSIALEFVQGLFIPHRKGDIYDLTANSLGICLASVVVYLYLITKRKHSHDNTHIR